MEHIARAEQLLAELEDRGPGKRFRSVRAQKIELILRMLIEHVKELEERLDARRLPTL